MLAASLTAVMVLTIEVPDLYPYAMLSATVLPFVTSFMLGGKVMAARSLYGVKLPNLYATPKYHEKADSFNRVQRGHQNMLETAPSVMVMSLIGGLKYPMVCIALNIAYCVGNYGYMLGKQSSRATPRARPGLRNHPQHLSRAAIDHAQATRTTTRTSPARATPTLSPSASRLACSAASSSAWPRASP